MLILQSLERHASAPPPRQPQGMARRTGPQEGLLLGLTPFTAAPRPKALKCFAPDPQAGVPRQQQGEDARPER